MRNVLIVLALITTTTIMLPIMILLCLSIPFLKRAKQKEDKKLLLLWEKWLQL